MKRKEFIKYSFLGSLITSSKISLKQTSPSNTRAYWISVLDKIASPILKPMSEGNLREMFKITLSPTWDNRTKDVAYLEAFGRLLAGIAPFIELPEEDTEEGKYRKKLKLWTQKCLCNAVNPQSPDYLTWSASNVRQYLVDAAYVANAILYAPNALWKELDTSVQINIVAALQKTRTIEPFKSNWLLFSAMCESTLLKLGDLTVNFSRIDTALDTFKTWYVGDGWYSDGDAFHFDYYNSYVIHTMLVDILRVNVAVGRRSIEELQIAEKRMCRYSHFLERLIAPDGTYPVFGRSSTYRMAAFQPLVKNALEHTLPEGISPAQVRCALTKVMQNVFIPKTFTKDGFLTLGLIGDQQSELADYYSNTGSMYITSLVFLPLGLPANDTFWTSKDEPWTSVRIWKGLPFPKDYAVTY